MERRVSRSALIQTLILPIDGHSHITDREDFADRGIRPGRLSLFGNASTNIMAKNS